MRLLLVVLLLVSPFAHAGFWANFCERHLIADNPYPYAEDDFVALVRAYKRTHGSQILTEITYRYRAGMLTPSETRAFWDNFR